MTVLLLIRHGSADPVGRWLAGRTPGIPLNAVGRMQAELLGDSLAARPLAAVYSSPLERALDTASAISRRHGLTVGIRSALTDFDYGDWTGAALHELAGDPRWQRFNEYRAGACAPGGECLVAVQTRVVDDLMAIAATHPGGTVAVVTHAEPIRCAIAHFSGRTLDDVSGVEVAPGCAALVRLGRDGVTVDGVNLRPEALVP